MSKTTSLIICLSIILLIYFSFKLIIFRPSAPGSISQKIKEQNFTLEIADTPYLLSKGLSNRSELCSNCGMLFIFKSENFQTFWMKETLIPLDMIFLNTGGKVTDIYTASPEPGKSDFELTLYKSTLLSKYVIELNAGIAKNLNLKVGEFINLNLTKN